MATGKLSDREQSHRSPEQQATEEAPDAPMTHEQAERLRVLSQEAGVPYQERLTRAAAQQRIEQLQREAGLAPGPRADTSAQPLWEERVDLNTAGREELRAVEGIGERRADEIVAWRRQHGRFESVEDLQHLPQFDAEVLLQLRDRLRV